MTGFPLEDRDGVLKQIRALVDAARQGQGGALVIQGAAGIGKTTMLAAGEDAAVAGGAVVMSASGVPGEAGLPFAALHQLLQPMLPGLQHLSDAHREALTIAFGLRRSAPPDLFLIALATLELVVDAAQITPVLLVIEDAHWLDRPTADTLAFVARRLSTEPIAMLIALRDGYDDPWVPAGLGLARLEPLTTAAADRTLRAHAPQLDPARRSRVLAEAAGNPLALLELSSLPEDAWLSAAGERLTLTARLERSFAGQLPLLPEETRSLLLILAADGACTIDEALWACGRLRGVPVRVSAFAPAVAAQLVRLSGPTARFRHPLIGSAIYQAADPAQQLAAHQALAEVLADQPDRSIWHQAAAVTGFALEVADRLEAMAGRALRRGAVSIAVAALSRAADLTPVTGPRSGRRLRSAELACQLGDPARVTEILNHVEGQALEDPEQARMLLVRETIAPGGAAEPGRIATLVRTAEQTRTGGDVDLALSLLWVAAARCFLTGAPSAERLPVVQAAERISSPHENARVLAILAYAAPLERSQVITQVLSRTAAPTDDVSVSLMTGSAALVVADYHTAAFYLMAAAEGYRAQGRLGQLARTLTNAGWAAVFTGDWDLSRTAADEGVRFAEETRNPVQLVGSQGVRATVEACRGDAESAELTALEVQKVGPPAGARFQYATTQLLRGMAAMGGGRSEDAYRQLVRLYDPADVAYHYSLHWWAIGAFAEAAAHSGQIQNLRKILSDLEPVAAQVPYPYLQVGIRYARAVTAEEEKAGDRFAEALAVDISRWPMDHGRLLLAYGAWLRRQRRRADSRVPLRQARDIFDALGAKPWALRAREELRASGETSQRRAATVLDQLSPQELHIAQLAASGLTNREIGQQLFLSHRTVSSHLYRLFPKLGITARSQLAGVVNGS